MKTYGYRVIEFRLFLPCSVHECRLCYYCPFKVRRMFQIVCVCVCVCVCHGELIWLSLPLRKKSADSDGPSSRVLDWIIRQRVLQNGIQKTISKTRGKVSWWLALKKISLWYLLVFPSTHSLLIYIFIHLQ